jgi:PAS domain-containing protein
MNIIAARYVRQAKKAFWCDCCGQLIDLNGEYIRIFGSEEGEEPKRRYYHLFCVPGQDQAPVIEAMKDVWYQNA